MKAMVSVILAGLLSLAPASAQEMRRGIYCDTENQAKQLVAYAQELDLDTAVQSVNQDHDNQYACADAMLLVIDDELVGTHAARKWVAQISKVTVIGLPMPFGVRPVIPPMPQVLVTFEKVPGA